MEGIPGDARPRAARVFFGGLGLLLLAAAPILLGHRSGNAGLLGRYSPLYAVLVAIHVSFTIGLLAVTWLAPRALSQLGAGLAKVAQGILRRGWTAALATITIWSAFLIPAAVAGPTPLGRSVALHVLGACGVLWITYGAIVLARPDIRARGRAIARYTICLVSLAILLAGVEGVLRFAPHLIPAAVMDALPGAGEYLCSYYQFDDDITVGYRYRSGQAVAAQLRESELLLRSQQRGLIRPLAPGSDRLICEASFTTDEIGYRNERPLRPTYAIAVSGDSFTSFIVEPKPWPDFLAEKLGQPVLNLGLQGYGPQSETEALIRFGLPRQPKWLILAFYEGNDLLNAEEYEEKKSSGLGWRGHDLARAGILERSVVFHMARSSALKAMRTISRAGKSASSNAYPFPFRVQLAGREVELTFALGYLARLSLPRGAIESLRGFKAALQSMKRLEAAASASGSKLIVVYCPTKEHTYIPLLPEGLVAEKLGGAKKLVLAPGGSLVNSRPRGDPVTAPELRSHLSGLRDALRDGLAAEGIRFLDLTPVLRQAASKGEQVYIPNDTHWTSRGHEVVAAAIADHIRRDP